MVPKRLSTTFILCLTILTADLLADVATHWLNHYTKSPNPYKATAIGMLVAVCIFYPAFELMNGVVKKTAQKYMSKTKNAVGSGSIGSIVAFLLALGILYCFYLKIKFNINLLEKFF